MKKLFLVATLLVVTYAPQPLTPLENFIDKLKRSRILKSFDYISVMVDKNDVVYRVEVSNNGYSLHREIICE